MGKVIVHTEYNWADEISFESWEIWDENDLEQAKQKVIDYWANGGKQFDICVGSNEEVEFYDLDCCLGDWCYIKEELISESDAEVLERLFDGGYGKVQFSSVVERIERIISKI